MTDLNFVWAETSHPLLASAEARDISGCSKEKCFLWRSGMLRLVRKHETIQSAQIILTAAGCEACSSIAIRQRDLGVITNTGRDWPSDSDTEDDIREASARRLAEKVQSFVPVNDQKQLL